MTRVLVRLLLTLWLCALPVLAQDEPDSTALPPGFAETYYEAYLDYLEGSELEGEGELASAHKHYLEAANELNKLRQEYPSLANQIAPRTQAIEAAAARTAPKPPAKPFMPEIVLVLVGLLLLLLDAFVPKLPKGAIAGIGAATCLLAIALNRPAEPIPGALYQADVLAVFFKNLLLLATAGVLLITVPFRRVLADYLSGPLSKIGLGEYAILPLFLCAGMMWMASAADLILLFVALELTTIGFYVQVSAMRRHVGSVEAGAKYLVLGALTTGILVYGIAWLYGVSGTTSLDALAEFAHSPTAGEPATLFALALLLLALGFKVGAAPAQLWIPDVYQGAPTPTTAFLSIASKSAGVVALLRVFLPFLHPDSPAQAPVLTALAILAVLTLLIGNLGALGQTNLKRLMGYSSIGHAGFLLLILASPGHEPLVSADAVGLYLSAYLLLNLTFFAVLAVVRVETGCEDVAALRGLMTRSPLLAVCALISLAGLAGVPLTVGFWAKFQAVALAVAGGFWWGVAAAIIGGVAGFYFYLKLAVEIFARPEGDADAAESWKVQPVLALMLVLLAAATLVFGFFADGISPGLSTNEPLQVAGDAGTGAH